METLQVGTDPDGGAVKQVTPDDCAVTRTLTFVGSRWTPLVVYHLTTGPRRYSELRALLPGISPKTLADRLHLLEEESILTRTVYPDKPPRVEYALTPRGLELGEILGVIGTWAERHEAGS
jgi:DNA-binding HxlR family transcriptional regulator